MECAPSTPFPRARVYPYTVGRNCRIIRSYLGKWDIKKKFTKTARCLTCGIGGVGSMRNGPRLATVRFAHYALAWLRVF